MYSDNLNPVRNSISNGIKIRIMRRVYLIWFFRKTTSSLAFKFYSFVAIFSMAAYHISFFDVIKNALNSSSSFFTLHRFFLNNFLAADLTDHILPLGVILTAIILVFGFFNPKKEEVKSISPLL